MNTRYAAKRRAKLRQIRAILMVLTVVILMVGALIALRNRHATHRTRTGANLDDDAAMIQQTLLVQQAIEAYARSHGGMVPADASAFDREILQGSYMPGHHLPASPWGGKQPDMLEATDRLRTSLKKGTDLGPADVSSIIRQETDLGALCYQAIGPKSYRLYGIGRSKEGGAAVIIQLGAPPK